MVTRDTICNQRVGVQVPLPAPYPYCASGRSSVFVFGTCEQFAFPRVLFCERSRSQEKRRWFAWLFQRPGKMRNEPTVFFTPWVQTRSGGGCQLIVRFPEDGDLLAIIPQGTRLEIEATNTPI